MSPLARMFQLSMHESTQPELTRGSVTSGFFCFVFLRHSSHVVLSLHMHVQVHGKNVMSDRSVPAEATTSCIKQQKDVHPLHLLRERFPSNSIEPHSTL